MPCRAASIRLPAPQCLWITDDILAEAFNRFARVSNARNKRGTEGRRYGSNVPGPLEAHRRSSKRRMGGAAIASSMPSPGPDLGSLFGLGGFTSNRKNDDWEWKPPGINERARDTGWLFGGAKKRKNDAWEEFLELPEVSSIEDASEKSKEAFEELLAGKDESMNGNNTDDLISFLQTSANEPDARNTLRFVEWLTSKDLTGDVYPALHELLLEKIQLQTLAEGELSSILCLMLTWDNDVQHAAKIASLLDEMHSVEGLAPVCVSVTESLLESMDPGQSVAAQLDLWLKVLRGVRHLQGDHHNNTAWSGVYSIIAERFPDFGNLKEHLSTLSRHDLARILLQNWVPRIAPDEADYHTGRPLPVVGGSKRYTRSQGRPSAQQLFQDFEDLQAKYRTRRERASGFTSFAQLITLLHQHRIPHIRVSRGIFDILMHSASASGVYQIFNGITRHAAVPIDHTLARTLIHYFLSTNRPSEAEKVFHTTSTLPLASCYELPIALARNRPCTGRRIWAILQRLTLEEIVPREQRDPKAPFNRLSSERVDLIHLVAFYFSQSKHMSPRSAFRRVWECYLFLRDRRVPMRSMMTRALVTAGIIRPLKDLQRVSMVKFRYVLEIVRRVEGHRVADDLDHRAWKIWNEGVLPRIRSRDARNWIDQSFGLGGAVQEEAFAAKSRLEIATKSYRGRRAWLFPPSGIPAKVDEPFPVPLTVGEDDKLKVEAPWQETVVASSLGDLAEKTALSKPRSKPLHQRLTAEASSAITPCSNFIENEIAGPDELRESPLARDPSPSRSFHSEPEAISPIDPGSQRHGLSYNDKDTSPIPFDAENEFDPRRSLSTSTTALQSIPVSGSSTAYVPMMGLARNEEAISWSDIPALTDCSGVEIEAASTEHPDFASSSDFVPGRIRSYDAVDPEWRFEKTSSDISIVRPTILEPRIGLKHKSILLAKPSSRPGPIKQPSYLQQKRKMPTAEVSGEDKASADVEGRVTETKQATNERESSAEVQSDKGDETRRSFNNHWIELQCWSNSILPASELPTHDFLLWRLKDDGRYHLFVEWRGAWRAIGTAARTSRHLRKQQRTADADEIKQRILAGYDGRAMFEVQSPSMVTPLEQELEYQVGVLSFESQRSDSLPSIKGVDVVPFEMLAGKEEILGPMDRAQASELKRIGEQKSLQKEREVVSKGRAAGGEKTRAAS